MIHRFRLIRSGAQPILYPLLLPAFPVLSTFSHNKDRLHLDALAVPILAIAGLTGIVWLVFGLVFRSAVKGAIIASLFGVIFVAYGHLREIMADTAALEFLVENHTRTFVALGGLFWLIAMTLALIRRDVTRLTPALNIVAISLLVIPVVDISRHSVLSTTGRIDATALGLLPDDDAGRAIDGGRPRAIDGDAGPGTLPDIYYIVPDRYPSESSLQSHFGFDNREFLDRLEELGFYVASKSVANYPNTFTSLASSLNMAYLDAVPEQLGRTSRDERPVYELLQDNRLQRFLRQEGYTYIHIGTWYIPTRENRYADVNYRWSPLPVALDGFSQQVLDTSLLKPLISEMQLTPYDSPYRNPHFQRYGTLYQFEKLEETISVDGPKFVFVHLTVPHPLFVFDRDGNDHGIGWTWDAALADRLFVDQLVYTNRRLLPIVERILDESPEPPIIIIQSDEGPKDIPSVGLQDGRVLWEEQDDHVLQVHMRILNAYHLPDEGEADLYESISPVNTFRVVLNRYFGQDLTLLEDRSHIIPKGLQPLNFIDATDRVRHD